MKKLGYGLKLLWLLMRMNGWRGSERRRKEVTGSLFHFLALVCLNKGNENDWGVGEKWEGGV
jgi:hypothetical protein